jgi:hypothetical protein
MKRSAEYAEAVRRSCQGMTREAFEKRYPHPWLLRELTADERQALHDAGPQAPRSTTFRTVPLYTHSATGGLRMATQLLRDPYRFAVLPVAKRGLSLWSARVLVGRALSNDIILASSSVSKLHAHLRREADGAWRVYDMDSANGTSVDGRRLEPGDAGGATVKGGSLVQFGDQKCEFIQCGELYDVLTG